MVRSALRTLSGTGQVQGGGQIGPVDPSTGRLPPSPYATFTGTGTGQGTGQATGHFVAAPGRGGGSGIPLRPPPGTYDPALDAQEGQATRGYQDLVSDTTRNRTYTTEDYNRAKDWTNTQTGWQVGDLKLGHAREGEDYGTANTIRKQNFDTATAERARQYGLLGQKQGSDINAAGLVRSGASALAAKIRAANQGREQGFAQTDFQRAQAEANLQHARAGEDYGTARQRVHDTKYHSLGELGVQVGRTRAGYTTTLGRASRELNQFKIDTNRSRFYEARSNQRWKPKKGLVKVLKARGLIY
jgi:hypothetical protein